MKTFILKVKGYSMVESAILDGDFVICEQTDDLRDGDIVAALVKSGSFMTLRKYFREGEYVRLCHRHPGEDSVITVPFDDLEVLGKMVGLLRGRVGTAGEIS